MSTIGFIGCGRIGSAMLKRLASKNNTCQLLAYDHNRSKIDHVNRYIERLTDRVQEGEDSVQPVTFIDNLAELVQKSDYIIIAIRRNNLDTFLDELTQYLTEDKVLISTMVSVPLREIRARTRYTTPVVRIMLNLPVVYGKGVVGICYPKEVAGIEIKNKVTYFLSEAQEDFIGKLLKPLGQKCYLTEDKFSIFTTIIACAPAYTFFFMEALLQAALTVGIPYLEAKKFVANSVEGSAYMGGRDTQTFADLRMYASPPGGICIRAINQMQLDAVQGKIINAILMTDEYNMAQEAQYQQR